MCKTYLFPDMTYHPDGYLKQVHQQKTNMTWSYTYDSNGNMQSADFGVGQTKNDIEFGERISRVAGEFPVHYDDNGNLISRHGFYFAYYPNGLLKSISSAEEGLLIKFYYIKERLVAQAKMDTNETLQYFYGPKGHLTHVYSSKRGIKVTLSNYAIIK